MCLAKTRKEVGQFILALMISGSSALQLPTTALSLHSDSKTAYDVTVAST